MAEDPAQTFTERRRRVEGLIADAERNEANAARHDDREPEYLLAACICRSKAICEHLGLQAAEPDDT